MSVETASEKLFEEFCRLNGIPCCRIAPASARTPDFAITLKGTQVACEVKQIDPNTEDLRELAELPEGAVAGRYLPNRLRAKLKNVSAQLKSAFVSGRPTLLVVYDNTPFKSYTGHADVVQAMFGRNSVKVLVPTDRSCLRRSRTRSSEGIVAWGPNTIRKSARSPSWTADPGHR